MRTSKSVIARLFFCTFLIFLSSVKVYSATSSSNWIIAAQKFTYAKGQNQNAVTDATAQMIPISILEKISKNLERNIFPDEEYERERYKLQTARQSLYLQLSNEYKKRDSIMLYDYSPAVLKSKINDQNNNIAKIEKQIEENLAELKKAQEQCEKNMELAKEEVLDISDDQESEFELIKNLFHRIFVKDESVISQENISLYGNDFTKLYIPSQAVKDKAYESQAYEKEMYNSKINLLITGLISAYGDFISVSVELYLYPGCKKVASLMEVGTLKEIDLLTTSLVGQMIPLFTNAMPVNIDFDINPVTAKKSTKFFIDDVLQSANNESIVIESGTHNIEFICEGYKSISTTYFFEGNKSYKIKINLEPRIEGHIDIGLIKPLEGEIFANAQMAQEVSEQKAQIKINGNSVLGRFIAKDGKIDFFYIPDNLYQDQSFVTIKPKPRDRDEYINNRRRWFYSSYSLLIVSLIPTFYTYGNFMNEYKLYNEENVSFREASGWQIASNVCQGVSIACGVFMVYELIRYLMAANSVLPQKAKAAKEGAETYYMPPLDLTDQSEEKAASDQEQESDKESEKSDEAKDDTGTEADSEIETDSEIESEIESESENIKIIDKTSN
ncbi:MAG: hypothetical protein K6C97_07280 [Treponema sp.]|nr:hypothetical protein [Treponema sp.]